MRVELVSPEAVLFSGDSTQILARTTDGEIAFLTGHAPFIGALDISEVRIWTGEGGEVASAAVHGGFVEVSHDTVTMLSDVAELSTDIDSDRATAAHQRATEALNSDPDDEAAQAALRRAEIRLVVSRRSDT